MELDEKQQFLVKALKDCHGTENIKNKQVIDLAAELGMERPNWFFDNYGVKTARGVWSLPDTGDSVDMAAQIIPIREEKTVQSRFDPNTVSEFEYAQVPDKDSSYVPFGEFKDIESIIRSQQFFPIFISGLSGNGKTFMVEQACSRAKRPMVRVQMSRETDEDDLIGGFRLVNGDTVWVDGPAVVAAKQGAILLLDEIDLGGPALMCLQPLLEGNGIFVKKTGEYVVPAPGFNILATANTKGKGDETGSFAHTGIMNEAMLDRFPVTLEQPYADPKTETKILEGKASNFGVDAAAEANFISDLVQWADNIRKTYMAGGMSEIVTTRRLESILKAFSIFGKHTTAIEMGISRFDEQTKSDMIRLYEKISGERTESNTQESEATDANDNPNAVPWN